MKKRSADDLRDFMKLARARFEQAKDFYEKQLQRELDDLRFLVNQWPDDLVASRSGQQAAGGLPAMPARPCLSIDTLRDPLAHIAAEAQQTDLGPEITPADDFAELVGPIDDTEITLREGLVRLIQRESDARAARNWAADRARKCGQGYYIVLTEYVSSRSNDQRVYVSGIYNQSSVRLDPRHEAADGSDADWEFYGTDMSWEDYKDFHQERDSKDDAHDDNDEWRSLGDQAPGWFTSTGKTRSVRVMNYFFTEREPVTLTELEDGRLVEALEPGMVAAVDEDGNVLTRDDVKKTVKWAKIDGAQILEETEWQSRHMPIVKVIWEQVQPYDEDRRYQGLVRPARDPAFGVSVMATTEVEVALIAPKTPVVGYAGQFEGFENAWDTANVRNIGRLEVNAKTDQTPTGTVLPHPQRLQASTDVGLWDGLRQMFLQAVKSTTGVPDATLGNVDPSVRSGRAIRQLIEQSRQGTSGGLGHLVQSVTYEAKIINSLLYPIYGRRPGRLLAMMTGKHESQRVIVGSRDNPRPFVRDAKQRPELFDVAKHEGQEPERFHLTEDADFNIAIRVSKDYDTRRQEESSMLGDLIQASPELMSWFGDLLFENQDGPGHKDLVERAKLMLAPAIQQKLTSGDGGLPPQAQAMVSQLQQQLQQATEIIKSEQIKQQAAMQKVEADKQIADLESQTEIHLQEMKDAAAIEIARISAAKQAADAQAEAEEERLATGLKLQFEAEQADLKRQHEIEIEQIKHSHAIELTKEKGKAAKKISLSRDPSGAVTSMEMSEGGV